MTPKPHWQDDLPLEVILRTSAADTTFGGAPAGTVYEAYLGRGLDKTQLPDTTWRLYLTKALDTYLEVREDDIIGAVQMPNGTSLVRVRPDATMVHARVVRAGVAGRFLSGGIAATHFDAAVDDGPDGPPDSVKKTCNCSL